MTELLADGVSFAVSFCCLTAMQPPRDRRSGGRAAGGVLDGLRFAWRDPYLRAMTAFSSLANLALTGVDALLVVFLVRTVGLSSAAAGLVMASLGVGGLLGALVARPWDDGSAQHAGAWDLLAGDLAQAGRCFTEMTVLAEARDQPWSLGSLLLAAWRGQSQETYALFDQVAAEAARQGQGYQLPFAGYARCVLELGQGRYDAAYASFPSGITDTSQLKLALPDLAEAAQRSGRHDATGSIARQLGRLTAASSSPVMLGFLARVRALAAGDSLDADDLYREAIDQHGRAPGPAHLARSQLQYGEWLRRARRPRDARVTLLQAYQLLNDIGADGFAERARAELAAAGETRPAPAAARHGGDLTPQEAHVARLAAAGATNAEIAAQLYLSSNTVDYHLRKVFRKLGVTSRRQLTRVKPDLGP